MKILLFNTNLAAKYVLSEIERGDNIIILTDQKSIKMLIERLNYKNVELHYMQSDGFSLFNLIQLYKARKKIRALFEQNNIEELVYFHQAFGGFFNWIITYAHGLGIRISYQRVMRQLNSLPFKGISAWKCKLKYKLFFSTDVNPIASGTHYPTPSLSQKFIRKNNIIERNGKIDNNAILSVEKKLFNIINLPIKGHVILLLTGSVLSTGQVEYIEYKEKMTALIQSLGTTRIICKCHPRFTDEIQIEKSLPHIPSYIPMELLENFFSIYIGYGSSVLIDVARQNKLSISLIDYFECTSPARHRILHQYFAHENVKFAKNIKDISLTINNYVREVAIN